MKSISLFFIAFTLGVFIYFSSFTVERQDESSSAFTLPELQQKRYSSSSYSLAVIDTETDSLVFGADEKRALTPASINKLYTSWNAFKNLGSDFSYETKLAYSGELLDGVLNGDLYLIGAGDPTIESSRFETTEGFFVECSKAARAAGIKKVEGDIICLAGNQRHKAHPNWTWQDIGNYYGAAVYDFNMFDNTLKVYFNIPKTIGDTAGISGFSPVLPIEVLSEVTASELKYDSSYFYGGPDQLERVAKGKLPAGRRNFRVRASLPNPPLMAAYLLKNELLENGVAVSGTHKRAASRVDGLKILYTYKSPSLLEIATVLNKRSMNLYAEALFKTVSGLKVNSYNGSYHLGSAVFEKELKLLFSDSTGFSYVDGSGLSRFNTCTALQMAELLDHFADQEFFGSFYSTLPVAGLDGTLEDFGLRSVLKEKVHAKTGSMTGVRSLAGYLDAKSGKRYSFAFIFNHFEGKSKYVKADFQTMLEKLYEEL